VEFEVDGVKRDLQRVEALMKSLSRNISNEASIQTIVRDTASSDNSLSAVTISNYLDILKKIFVLDDLDAWSPNLRSKTIVRNSPIRHFVDPSIATASLGISPEDLINDYKTFGLFFESLCIRDLRIYSDSFGARVYHYRDKDGLEVDAIIHRSNGTWAGVEIKMGDHQVNDAVKNLIKLKNKIDAEKMKEPSFLMVLTGGTDSYKTREGIYVVSIGSLKN
jgi:predicted AAA+ superfamily ATPase